MTSTGSISQNLAAGSPSGTAFVSSAFVSEVRAAITAGFRLLVVVTREERRARTLLGAAFRGSPTVTWTPTSGGDLATALSRVTAAGKPGVAPGPGPGGTTSLQVIPGAPVVNIFVDVHPSFSEPAIVRRLREIGMGDGALAVLVVPTLAGTPPELEAEMAFIPLALPGPGELGEVYDGVVAALPPEVRQRVASWDRGAFVRAAAGLTELDAGRAFRLALKTGDADPLRRVIAEKRRVLRQSATLELLDEPVSLDEVGGLDVLKAWLKTRLLAFGDAAREFLLPEPRGMLVCGVQGCGKSLVSKAAAAVLGLPLVRLDFAAVFASTSPEQALREALAAVEAIAPAVLWVDEIEKGLSESGGSVRVFGAFLTWLQERKAPVFVAATANEVAHLPPELARRGRFDEVFFVDLPSPKEREEIVALALRSRGRDPTQFAVADLVKGLDHFSGAELHQVVVSALFRAFAQGQGTRDVTDDDLRGAAREVVPLATLYEEKVQALRTWGRARARKASADRRMLDLFDG